MIVLKILRDSITHSKTPPVQRETQDIDPSKMACHPPLPFYISSGINDVPLIIISTFFMAICVS